MNSGHWLCSGGFARLSNWGSWSWRWRSCSRRFGSFGGSSRFGGSIFCSWVLRFLPWKIACFLLINSRLFGMEGSRSSACIHPHLWSGFEKGSWRPGLSELSLVSVWFKASFPGRGRFVAEVRSFGSGVQSQFWSWSREEEIFGPWWVSSLEKPCWICLDETCCFYDCRIPMIEIDSAWTYQKTQLAVCCSGLNLLASSLLRNNTNVNKIEIKYNNDVFKQ